MISIKFVIRLQIFEKNNGILNNTKYRTKPFHRPLQTQV